MGTALVQESLWGARTRDYAEIVEGVALQGIREGSPAEKAGLRKGDILIRLGNSPVADLQGFTDALGAHKPGDEVEIIVLREGREVRLRAVLGRRGG